MAETRRSVLGSQVPAVGVLLTSAARTADPTYPEFGIPQHAVGLMARIDATASAATPSVVFTVQGWDEAANEWFDILASAAVTGAGTTTLKVDPRIANSANAIAQHGLVPRMRLKAVHADGDSITYSVTLFAWG